jgi:hypothetical protein
MTRDEKQRRVQRLDGKVFEIHNVRVDPTYLNPEYVLSAQPSNEISPTGWLKIFELSPTREGAPSFVARWDGGSRDNGTKQDLDIDIYGVSEEDRSHFNNERGGYSGHRSINLPNTERHTYSVSIRLPSELIFEATVSFGLLRKLGFEARSQGFAASTATLLNDG